MEQKTSTFGWILFAVIGVAALVLGIVNAEKNISSPFVPDAETIAKANAINAADNQETDKSKDTDSDGVSDYDEKNTYHTSPYLKDSDSDGVDDKAEITRGTDPNCPEGKQCNTQIVKPSEISPTDLGVNTNSDVTPSNTSSDASADAATVRALLKEQGVPDEALNQIDDATLLQLYAESLDEASKQAANQNTNSGQ